MFESRFSDIEIPNVSIYEYLFGSLGADDLERTALIDPATGAETSYGALVAQINAFAGAMAVRGSRKTQ